MLLTMFFSHNNNIVTTLFSHDCCNNLLTGMPTLVNMVVLSIQSILLPTGMHKQHCHFIIVEQYRWSNNAAHA